MPTATPLRARKRQAAMARIQDAAYVLLVERGYDAMTVADVADAAEVSPSSVYRYFGTKEGIFVWDPLAAPFAEHLEESLSEMGPMSAVEASFLVLVESVDPAVEEELRSRTRLILAEPDLRRAMRNMIYGFGDELASAFIRAGSPDLEARTVAASTTAALTVGVEHWARNGAQESLAEVVREAFRALRGGMG